MSLFGWSLPPGCGTLPGEEDAGACSVCGNSVDADLCICHECPTCGSTGDPKCYHEHGLVWSETQQESWDKNNKMWEEEAELEEKFNAAITEEYSMKESCFEEMGGYNEAEQYRRYNEFIKKGKS